VPLSLSLGQWLFDARRGALGEFGLALLALDLLQRSLGADPVTGFRPFDQLLLRRFRKLRKSVELVRGIDRRAGETEDAPTCQRQRQAPVRRTFRGSDWPR
jgi:hypothetical protein